MPNQWVFVAVRYNQTAGTMSLDVNGTFTNATTDFDLNQLNTLTIGRNPSFAAWFTGKIDQVFVYNQVLTVAQLNTIQKGSYAEVTGGLTLDGTAKLGGAGGGTSARLDFEGSQALSGTGSVVLGASAGNGLFAQGNNGSNPATLDDRRRDRHQRRQRRHQRLLQQRRRRPRWDNRVHRRRASSR